MSSEQNPPKVFISYSHDSQEHFDRVLLLSDTLREWGIDCHIDQYELAPVDWLRWMERRIREADFVLIVCTATYCRRFNGEEEPGKGLGVRHEGGVISVELYNRQTETAKFIPVVFSAADSAHIPTPLQATNRHALNMEQLETDRGFENLYRQLTKQPRVVPKPIGKMRSLPPINRQEDFDKDSKTEVSGPSSTQQQRIVRIVGDIAQSGEVVSASIELDAQGDENAFAFSLIFDSAHLSFMNAALGKDANAATLNVNTTQSANGQVGLAIALPTGQCILAGKNKKLLTVLFSAKVDETWNQNNLQFGDQPITREVASAQANKLSTSWSPDLVTFLSLPKIVAPPKPQLRHENFVEQLDSQTKLEMIAIPGGSFLMGSEDFENTKPVHPVKLSPFHIGKFQITQAQWKAVMKNNPSHFKGDTLPVESVSWNDAVSFCEKLSKQTGRTYRLPTEAEWEYACLAGSTGEYCFGDDEALLKDYAWYNENSGSKTHPVGEKKPNNWDLHDMHGNVWEWCQDWYEANYYAELARQGEAVNPQGPANGERRILRGGSWYHFQLFARAVSRYYSRPAFRGNLLGFRVVLCRPPSSS